MVKEWLEENWLWRLSCSDDGGPDGEGPPASAAEGSSQWSEAHLHQLQSAWWLLLPWWPPMYPVLCRCGWHWHAGVFAGFRNGVPPGQGYEDSALLLCGGWRSGHGPLVLTHQCTVRIWTIWIQNHRMSLRKTSPDLSGLMLRLGSFQVQQNKMKLGSMSVFEKNVFSTRTSSSE